MAGQFYTSLPSAEQFKRDHFDATVKCMLQSIVERLNEHIADSAKFIKQDAIELGVEGLSKEAVKAVTDQLSLMGYSWSFIYEDTAVQITLPDLGDTEGAMAPKKKRKLSA